MTDRPTPSDPSDAAAGADERAAATGRGMVRAYARGEFPSRGRLLWRGFSRRCAWCGDRRAYFLGWFKRQERCRSCGHVYRRGDEAFELGAITVNFILTGASLLLVILLLVVLTAPDIPVLGVTIAAGAVAVLGPVLFYPLSFSVWQAIDLFMRPPTDDEIAGHSDGHL